MDINFTRYSLGTTHARIFREEFTQHGMDDIVTLTHRNACKDGFTVTDTADAGNSFFVDCQFWEPTFDTSVFLDLPAPWDAVDHAKKALRVRMLCHPPRSFLTLVSERHHNTYLLLQSMHGTSSENSQCIERSRLYRFEVLFSTRILSNSQTTYRNHDVRKPRKGTRRLASPPTHSHQRNE
jgi:tRNA methyltransferase complex GCD14 subunit